MAEVEFTGGYLGYLRYIPLSRLGDRNLILFALHTVVLISPSFSTRPSLALLHNPYTIANMSDHDDEQHEHNFEQVCTARTPLPSSLTVFATLLGQRRGLLDVPHAVLCPP